MRNAPSKRPESGPKLSSKESTEFKDSSAIIAAAEVGKAAYIEAVGMDESVETTGRVSEVLSESDEIKGDAAGGGQAKGDDPVDPEELKARLLKNIPTETVMRKQIEKEIKKEIDYLHKKAMKMIRSPKDMNYFEMNNIVRKIRELRKLLKQLVKTSLDALKGLWLRYVHGIM